MSSFRSLAFVRFPGRQIIGGGQFALTSLDSPDQVWLFVTSIEAREKILDHARCKITDLLAPVNPVRRYPHRNWQEPDDK